MKVSYFRNVKDNKPKPKALDWPDLAHALTRHKFRDTKDGALWSPTSYKNGSTRGKEAVEDLCALVLDFDDGVRPTEFASQWGRWEYVLHSTFSHSRDKPKFRAVFPLQEPVPAEEWSEVYRKLALALGQGHTDPQCKDCSRVYYLPSAPTGGEVFSEHHPGDPLNPEEFPEPEPEPTPEPTRATPDRPTADRYIAAALEGELSDLRATAEGGRNNQLNQSARALGKLVGGGHLAREVVETELEAAALTIGLEPGEIEATIRSGLDSGIKEPRGIPEREPRVAVIGAGAAAEGDRPALDAGDQSLPRITKAVWDTLESSNDPPYLFRYGGRVAWLDHNGEGDPAIAMVDQYEFRHVVARAANWYRMKREGDEWVPKDAMPTMDVIRDVLATQNKPLPVLEGITQSPVFTPNGTLHHQPGYHLESQLAYVPDPSLQIPDVTACPTGDAVGHAKNLLLTELLGEFPFVGEEEKAHAVALFLLPFVRSMIDGPTPLHLIEKPSPGTGAGLLAYGLLFPSLGHDLPVLTESYQEDEWRKRITALLREGTGAIFIDNIRRQLNSATVSAAITATWWTDRLLGTSETVSVPVRCCWLAAGNNPSLSSEITRRTIRIRLDAKQDRPWLREGFKHPDLRSWVKKQRGALIGAGLTLIRNWLAAGKPSAPNLPTLGMFEEWSRTMGGILACNDIPGFLANLTDFYEDSDTEGEIWRSFLGAWWEKYQGQQVGVADLFDLIQETDSPFDLGDGSERSQKTRLGKQLTQARDRQFDHLRIAAGDKVKRAQQWELVNARQDDAPSSGEPGERFSPRGECETSSGGEPGEPGERFAPRVREGGDNPDIISPAAGGKSSPGSPEEGSKGPQRRMDTGLEGQVNIADDVHPEEREIFEL